MILPDDFKKNLIGAIEELPATDEQKKQWLVSLAQEDVPKDTLFDIAMVIEATEEASDTVKEVDKKIDYYFAENRNTIEQNDKQIDASLTELEKEVDALEDEYNAKSSPEEKQAELKKDESPKPPSQPGGYY